MCWFDRAWALRVGVITGILAASLTASKAMAQVTVTGETNMENPGEFVWTVTNQGEEPITLFEAPHYYGKLFTPPENWTIDKETGNVGHGDELAPGIVRSSTESPAAAIRRGMSKKFRLRLDPRGGHYAAGTITIGFRDGTTRKIRNVLCPAKPPFLQNYFPAIGLGVLFVIFLGGKRMRDTRRKRQAASGGSPEAE